MTKSKQRYSLFTGKALLLLIAPIVIEQIFSTSLGLFDSMMVSSIADVNDAGEIVKNASTAISNVDQINNLIIQLFSAFATGGAIITSQYLGAKNLDDANKSAKQVLVLVGLVSVGLAGLCLALNWPLLKLFYGGAPENTFDYMQQYFYLTAASFPFIGIFNASAALLRAQRKSFFTMSSAVLSCALNVGFNALFIYALNLRVIGAGLATLICRSVPAIFMLCLLCKKNYAVHVKIFEKFRFDKAMIKKILHLAIPSGIEACLFQLGKLMTSVFINIEFYTQNGTNVQANANSVASNINNIASVVGGGVGTSALTVVGQAVGTGDVKQTKYYMKKMFIISYLANAVTVALIMGTAQWLVLLYDYPDSTRQIALNCLYMCLAFQFVTYPLSFTTPAILKATSDVKYVMFAAIGSMILMRVGVCFILTTDILPFRMGAMGFWIAMCADWVARSVLFISRLLSGRWKKSSGLLREPCPETVTEIEETENETTDV
ncbi:MAG: polysaccharide biosynthesis C-terminal domain-containing protein [Clostridia bacterium]|nr:polysaccharide biosynthesis C-terminal domain-containing protein [Clostridia bacterium]